LRPSMLDDFGLLPALEWQAREIGKRTGLRVGVTSEMSGELPEEHKSCVYRVVQEALNNCAQHAQASAVQVSVGHAGGQILVTVQDDGTGFDPKRVRGLGLLGMEERVRHLGGTFQIDSEAGRGTLLRVTLPQREVVIPEPEHPADLLWDGVPYGADSHLAG
jgi:signal transduction histidine kinase